MACIYHVLIVPYVCEVLCCSFRFLSSTFVLLRYSINNILYEIENNVIKLNGDIYISHLKWIVIYNVNLCSYIYMCVDKLSWYELISVENENGVQSISINQSINQSNDQTNRSNKQTSQFTTFVQYTVIEAFNVIKCISEIHPICAFSYYFSQVLRGTLVSPQVSGFIGRPFRSETYVCLEY